MSIWQRLIDLNEIERLADEATPGPWDNDDTEESVYSLETLDPVAGFGVDSFVSDREFIAAARNAVPALVAEVRRLREIERIAGRRTEEREIIAGALGYHPDTETDTLLSAIESIRHEARGYADLSRDLHDARAEIAALKAEKAKEKG